MTNLTKGNAIRPAQQSSADALEVLPTSWALVEIDQLLLPLGNNNVLQQGWSPQCESESAPTEDEWGVLKTTAIQEGEFLPHHNKRLPEHLEPRPQIEVALGDILMTCAGPRSRCGVVCLVRRTRKRLLMSGKMYRFRGNPLILSSTYLEAFLHSRAAKLAIDKMKTGINDSGLNLTHDRFKKLLVPVAPAQEQLRIVAKIDELFSELDKGVESLKTAQAQLKVYRQALLKHAFEGKLTAQWRADHPDQLESADSLLKRIQQERAERYRQQLADWEAAGKQGSKPKAPKTLSPLNEEELVELPALPEGWIYTYLAELGDLGRGKSKHRPRNDPRLFGGDYPFLQTGEVKAANRVVRKFTKTYSDLGLQQSKLWPTGTLCITIAANIAETAFLGFDACFPDSVVGFSALKRVIFAEYVDFFIQGVRTRIEAYAPATAQKNINLETLENLVVPFCSFTEQRQVIDVLEERFSVIDQLDQTITTSLQQAEALRQSILKKAFSGQLVPQDPHDEPASVLLARIKAARELATQKPAAIGRRTRKAAA